MPQDSFLDSMKFNPIVYQRNDIDLAQLGKTFETLRVMHEEAMENKTKLETVIANTPLDESEEWYRKAILDTIQTAISEKTDGFGLAGAAQSINELVANITNSKEFRGKVAANAAHKEFVKRITDDKNLSSLEKEYYLEMNPYKYDNNLVDTDGREIMYDWTNDPNRINVIYAADMEDVLKRALSITAKRHYGDAHPIFEAFSGDETKIKAIDIPEYLPFDEIYEAMKTIIDTDDDVKNGLRRKFDIGKWHDKKYSNAISNNKKERQIPTDSATGLPIEYSEWKDRILTSYASLAEYYTGLNYGQLNSKYRYEHPGEKGSGSRGNKVTSVKLTPEEKEAKNEAKKIKTKKASNNASSRPRTDKSTETKNKPRANREGGRK